MIITLKNDLLTVKIESLGAELQSIKNNISGQEYLWHGDSRFWGRRSPVLFPIVGSVWEGRYRMDGREYTLGQHGFARDCEFTVMDNVPDDEAWFELVYDDESLALYPRRFGLQIGYRLQGERLTVLWRVSNRDDKAMTFQIGAHPAFNYPDFSPSDSLHAYFLFDNDNLQSEILAEKGCVGEGTFKVELDEMGLLSITAETFKCDTIVLADSQVHRVSMLDKHRQPYLSVLFDAPLVGLWSPAPDAPFVCIEPWYGRCDRAGFEGSFEEREHVNTIEAGSSFNASYMIIFENL
ncbi:MAG: aldose 1-epimerase family protein [Clostridiales bacterium]|nr:aldose 1-epimerase family protein [Clostridiales bacterium]